MTTQQPITAEAIARIIEPGAWQQYDAALRPYVEGRGSSADENGWYAITWQAGCRSVEDVRKFLLEEPFPDRGALLSAVDMRESLVKAEIIFAEISRLRSQVETLERENAALAAGACPVSGGLLGDEYGNMVCQLKAQVETLTKERDEATKLTEEITKISFDHQAQLKAEMERLTAALTAEKELVGNLMSPSYIPNTSTRR